MKKSLALTALLTSFLAATEINLYTARHYDADAQIYKLFEEKTGIKVNATQAKAEELIKKLELEGKNSIADLFIAADVGNFYAAKSKGLLQKASSAYLEKAIPANLRDSDNQWFGITKRARVIVYDKAKFDPSGIKNYEDLTKPELKGKLLIRSSSSSYNKSLLASIIANDGEKAALEWAKGVVANMARIPKGGDRDQAKAIHAGEGLVAVMNTYYLGLMLNSQNPKDVEVAKSLGIIFPNQDNRGTHINVSAVALTSASKNKDAAVKFMEFLLSKEAQQILAGANYEYPISKEVKPSATVQAFGEFKEDTLSLSKVGENISNAVKIFDMAEFR